MVPLLFSEFKYDFFFFPSFHPELKHWSDLNIVWSLSAARQPCMMTLMTKISIVLHSLCPLSSVWKCSRKSDTLHISVEEWVWTATGRNTTAEGLEHLSTAAFMPYSPWPLPTSLVFPSLPSSRLSLKRPGDFRLRSGRGALPTSSTWFICLSSWKRLTLHHYYYYNYFNYFFFPSV